MKDALNSYQLMVEEVGPDVAMEIALLIPNMPELKSLYRVKAQIWSEQVLIVIDTGERSYQYLVNAADLLDSAILLGTAHYIRTMIIQQKLTRLEEK